MTLFRHRDTGETAACEPRSRLHRLRSADPAWECVDAPTAPLSAAERFPDVPTYDEAVAGVNDRPIADLEGA